MSEACCVCPCPSCDKGCMGHRDNILRFEEYHRLTESLAVARGALVNMTAYADSQDGIPQMRIIKRFGAGALASLKDGDGR